MHGYLTSSLHVHGVSAGHCNCATETNEYSKRDDYGRNILLRITEFASRCYWKHISRTNVIFWYHGTDRLSVDRSLWKLTFRPQPTGRILSVFGKDVDSMLNSSVHNLIYMFLIFSRRYRLSTSRQVPLRALMLNCLLFYSVILVSMRLCKYTPILWYRARANNPLVILTIASVLGAVIIITVLEHYFRKIPPR